jgi:hypothetical protein
VNVNPEGDKVISLKHYPSEKAKHYKPERLRASVKRAALDVLNYAAWF